MDFSEALAACKAGGKITRSGWNGADQWVAMSPGFELHADRIFSAPVKEHVGSGTGQFAPYLMIHNAQGVFVPWVASQGDLLAGDWIFSCDDGLYAKEPAEPDLPSATVTSNTVTVNVSTQDGSALTGPQIRELTETIQAKLIQQAKRGRATGINLLPGRG
jgi:Protein of unknown function (DUF2829)